jgi:hypothetical protein
MIGLPTFLNYALCITYEEENQFLCYSFRALIMTNL